MVTQTKWWMGLIFAVMLILGIWMIGGMRGVPELNLPLVDSATYHRQAVAWAAGQSSSAGPFWQAPLYPAFLAAIYRVAGPRPLVARAVQVFLLALGVGLTFCLARRWFSSRGSAVAAGLTALCGPLWFYTLQLMPVIGFMVLSLAALLMTLRAFDDSRRRFILAAGLLWGMAALTIPTVLFAVGVLMLFLLLRRTDPARPIPWLRMGGLVLAMGLVILPVTLRNRWVGGDWVLISANSGINFYIGNNARTDVTLATRPGLDWERLERLPYLAGARSAAEADRYFRREAWDWIRSHPLAFVLNELRKVRDFFQAREIPRNLDLATLRIYSPGLRFLTGEWMGLHWPGGILIPLALVGWIGLARRSDSGLGVGIYGAAFAVGVCLFFSAGRYRAPLWPLIAIGAVAAIDLALTTWRARRWISLAAGTVGVIVLAVAVNFPWAHPTDGIAFTAELERVVGAALEVRGDVKSAEARYRRALELDPENADAYYLMGNLCRAGHRGDEALHYFREALRLRPDHDSARGNLGFLLYERGAIGPALNELELAVRLNPLNAAVHHNLGVVLQAVGRSAEAESHFQKARAIRNLFARY
jgi:4-amino-4-deoxy-L-arabinose transferase-like glycosyltransferase